MLYLFDLDDTLVKTNDLAGIREAGKSPNTQYKNELLSRLGSGDRRIWTAKQLRRLLEISPLSDGTQSKCGIFSRSPRAYIDTICSRYFPDFQWDAIIAYEDVAPLFKPHGHGIRMACERTGSGNAFMIGDDDGDIKAAYHAVCHTAWFDIKKDGKFNYSAYDLLPDFIFQDVDTFLEKMASPNECYLALEADETAEKTGTFRAGNSRTFTFFCPDKQVHKITAYGRHFSKYAPLQAIRACHPLTAEIEACKTATVFPQRWVDVLIHACREQVGYLRHGQRVILTCVPPRPGRDHRLGRLISQCETYFRASRYSSTSVHFDPNVFRYKNGVRSNSNEHLGREERFANITENLELSEGVRFAAGDKVIVVDDVVTSGSTLIGAEKLLKQNGVGFIKLVAMAKNVGQIMPEKWRSEQVYSIENA